MPRMAYVNKMDITGADFYRVVNMIHERLKANAVPIQLPIGKEADFKGLIDLVEMKAYVYYDELVKDIREEEIPADMQELAEEYHTNLLESVAEMDEDMFEKYCAGEKLTEEEIRKGIRLATIANKMVPVTCGTSYKNKGVQKLLTPLWIICLHRWTFLQFVELTRKRSRKRIVLLMTMARLLRLHSRL